MLAKFGAIRLTLLLVLMTGLSGCGTIRYYGQLATGQWQVLSAREPVRKLLNNPLTDQALAGRLQYTQRVLVFAAEEMRLPAQGQYNSYANLNRDHAVWAVFAAPALSLENMQWCYPLIGCAAYRGFFSPGAAQAYAAMLEAQGMDTAVIPVDAYSTLGWFSDPLLNTFLYRTEPELAALLFHELAHQLLYIPDDTRFNESFASVIETEGLERWLRRQGQLDQLADWKQSRQQHKRFSCLVQRTYGQLQAIYAQALSGERGLLEKQRVLAETLLEFDAMADTQPALEPYRGWVESLNNARLVALQSYDRLAPAFRAILRETAHDLPRFYARVRALAELEPAERNKALLDAASCAGQLGACSHASDAC